MLNANVKIVSVYFFIAFWVLVVHVIRRFESPNSLRILKLANSLLQEFVFENAGNVVRTRSGIFC